MSNALYRPIVTEGDPCQKPTGCNITQPASNFSANLPSAADRAKEGMAHYAAQRANEADFRAAKEAAKERQNVQAKRFLSNEEIEG